MTPAAQVDKLADAAYWRYLEALGDGAREQGLLEAFVRDTDSGISRETILFPSARP